MTIYKGTLKTGVAYKGSTSLSRIYKGTYLVFEAFKTLIAEGVPPLTLLNCAAEIMLGYKIYGNSRQQLLPDGYTQLEYIRATGTQYIDTGVAYDDTSIEVNFIGTIETNSTLFGIRRSGRISNTFKVSSVNNKIRVSKYSEDYDTDLSMSSSIIYNFILNNNDFIVDGTTLYSFSTSAYTTNFNLYLFAEDVISTDGSSSTAEAKAASKCYACKIYKNNVLIRNFVPCKNSSNVAGLYDIVNNTFYTNQGTGSFTVGAETITPFEPVEIESVGDKTINLCSGFCAVYPTDEVMSPYKFPVKAGTVYSIDFGSSTNAYKTLWLYDMSNNKNQLITYAYATTGYNKMAVKPQQDGYLAIGCVNARANVICAEGLYYTLSTAQQNSLNTTQITTNVNGGTMPYEPYGYKIPVNVTDINNITTTTNIYLSEPLRKLGSYSDYLDFESGKVVRKINYNYVTGLFNEITRYSNYSRYGGYQFSPRNIINLNVEKCNYLPYSNDPNGFFVGANTGASFYLYDDVTGVTAEDDTGAKRTAKAVAWLQSLSPRLRVYYVLETEIEETVTLPDILLNKGTNVISIGTSVQPSNMWIKYKGK